MKLEHREANNIPEEPNEWKEEEIVDYKVLLEKYIKFQFDIGYTYIDTVGTGNIPYTNVEFNEKEVKELYEMHRSMQD